MKPSSILGSCSRRALPRAPSSTIMTLRVLYPNDLALYHDNAPATPTAPKRNTNIAPCTPTASSATSTSRPLRHLAPYINGFQALPQLCALHACDFERYFDFVPRQRDQTFQTFAARDPGHYEFSRALQRLQRPSPFART